MIIVETKEVLTSSSKEEIESRLRKITEAGKFVHEPDCTMKDAENKCFLQS